MGSYSLTHWIIVLIVVFGFGFPIYRSLKRAGLSGAWAIFCIIPFLAIIPLWVLALSNWNTDDPDGRLSDVFK